MEGRVFENFQKNQKKFQKSKHAQKRSQKCPNVFWRCFGVIFSKKIFAQCSMEGRVFENFPKTKNFSKFQKCPKSFPKVSKRVLKMFQGDFFEKTFRPVFHGGSSLRKFSKKSKNFQNSKHAKIVPKSFQTCFEDVLGWFFRKKNLPSFPWRVESSKNFKKIKKVSKFQKCPKSSPKVSKRV